MEKLLNNSFDDVIDTIKNSDNYKRYLLVSEQIKNNKEIMDKVNIIKKLQREVVKLEYNKEDISLKEKEIKDLLDELNTYPIYLEYIYLQEDLNNTFQNIKNIIEDYITDVIN